MMIIEEVGALIMWLAVFIGWLIKDVKPIFLKNVRNRRFYKRM